MDGKSDLPSNVHVSSHPCLQVKLSQLRDKDTDSKTVKTLIHDISLIVACEALASTVTVTPGQNAESPLGFAYQTYTLAPASVSVVPVLRSGLSMVEAVQTLLPTPPMVHHIGLYREPATLEPVEYYNNLPAHMAAPAELAIICDPVLATGGTMSATIQTLREWGARRIVVFTILAAAEGLRRAAAEWPEGVEIWVAGVDEQLTAKGMLAPGLGDIGDRLFGTVGK